MRLPFRSLALFLLGAASVAAIDSSSDSDTHSDSSLEQSAAIYVEPVSSVSSGAAARPPVLLAEVRYDAHDLSKAAEVASYEVPDFDSEGPNALYRVGLYDAAAGRWLSATSVTAAANFAKGVRPHFALSVSVSEVVSVAVRGLPIDAGATRDFGPQATVVRARAGKTPALNRPIVLSPEGKKVEPPAEKTMLQKYWWVIAVAVLLMTAGGGEK